MYANTRREVPADPGSTPPRRTTPREGAFRDGALRDAAFRDGRSRRGMTWMDLAAAGLPSDATRRRLVAASFDIFDADEDDVIAPLDFKLLARRIDDAVVRPSGGRPGRAMDEGLSLWWYRLTNGENTRVTRAEYTEAMLGGLLSSPGDYRRSVRAVLDEVLRALAPGGALTAEQGALVFAVFNAGPETGDLFAGRRGTETVTHDEFQLFFAAYFFGGHP
ncbi:hypothetical protein [Spirillospora sp. NBC_01491]|uniref:hypothetical protein n=1 Tax=Spirillospora sp. NBC_01491 TaxID=2976007 RepID=UPI002E370277|nr:hypothetical protein [Spirillospora sp. NBC_01491]